MLLVTIANISCHRQGFLMHSELFSRVENIPDCRKSFLTVGNCS